MKKRILPLMIAILLTTGCTCEYNLTIDGNEYKEEIIITGESSNEITIFNNNWQISVDKENNRTPGDPESAPEIDGDIYKYNLSGNKLKFNYDFSRNEYTNSTAVSSCYNKLTVLDYNNTIVISTSPNANCFDNYPPLSNLKVTINVDREVINNNADSINGNTYTWIITKDNAKDKSINIILDNSTTGKDNNTPNNQQNNEIKKDSTNNYILYIFLGILLIIIFIGYNWFNKLKNKNNGID